MKRSNLLEYGRSVRPRRDGPSMQSVWDPSTYLLVSGYNYLGPQNKQITHELIAKYPPKNALDKLAMLHDIRYQNYVNSGASMADIYAHTSEADRIFLADLQDFMGDAPDWNEWYAAKLAYGWFSVKGRYAGEMRMLPSNEFVEEEEKKMLYDSPNVDNDGDHYMQDYDPNNLYGAAKRGVSSIVHPTYYTVKNGKMKVTRDRYPIYGVTVRVIGGLLIINK